MNVQAFIVALALTEGHGRISFETNVAEQAWGPHQIRPIMVAELHRLSPGYPWHHEDAATWNPSAAMVGEWLLQMRRRKPDWTAEDFAWAWNAGPDRHPEALGYRKRFLKYYKEIHHEVRTDP